MSAKNANNNGLLDSIKSAGDCRGQFHFRCGRSPVNAALRGRINASFHREGRRGMRILPEATKTDASHQQQQHQQT